MIQTNAPKARDFTNRRVRRNGEIDEALGSKNRCKSKVRARVELVFSVVNRLWGFGKERHRGLAKNATRSFIALCLANIYLARGHWHECVHRACQGRLEGPNGPQSLPFRSN